MLNFGKPTEHGPVTVHGIQLKCTICQHDSFWGRELALSTPFFSFLNLEDWSRTAHCAVCERCGYVHMFIPPPIVEETNVPTVPDAAPA